MFTWTFNHLTGFRPFRSATPKVHAKRDAKVVPAVLVPRARISREPAFGRTSRTGA